VLRQPELDAPRLRAAIEAAVRSEVTRAGLEEVVGPASPSSAKRRAVARPTPADAPVTTTIRAPEEATDVDLPAPRP
jgi:hypothetical protein